MEEDPCVAYAGYWEREKYDPKRDEIEDLGIMEIFMRNDFRRQQETIDYQNGIPHDKAEKDHLKNLKDSRTQRSMDSGYRLYCQFNNFRPKIWRRIVVPGNLSLYDLNDRVLNPLFGFCRNYHAHYFKKYPFDRRKPYDVGIVYGPVGSSTIGTCYVDLMHIQTFGMKMVDSKDVLVSDVFKKAGEEMMYVHDLGDHYKFTVTVEKIITSQNHSQYITLLDGGGCNLPEDADGNSGIAKYFHSLEKYQNDPEKIQEIREKINNSCNYSFNGEQYPTDPNEFELGRCKTILQITIKTNRSEAEKDIMTPTKLSLPMNSEQYKELKKMMKFCRWCKAKGVKMKKCSNCLISFYCSRDCQVKDWGYHKLSCRKLNDG